MAAKRKHAALAPVDDDPVDPSDELMFLCLGGGNEVGRSSHIIQYKGKTVMLDAGMHPAYDGLQALPFYDEFDLSTVDVLLISHFHIDHAASLPYVLAKTNFRGRVFMTHPTKAIYKWLLQDSVRVGNMNSSAENRTSLYTEADHLNTFPLIEAIDYYTTHTISSIRITPYPAGHVLGAAMFLIEIAGLKILFTGDYSREDDRHLVSASIPRGVGKIDVLITESTFGISSHVPRAEREAALMRSITSVLNRGGRALLPVFALGRAQELLLIFDEYWWKHPEYRRFPIYYLSNLAKRCMLVYQTYISAMNDNIKRLFRERNAAAAAASIEAQEGGGVDGKATQPGGGEPTLAGPWDFRFVRSLKSLDRFEDVGGCVMLATPGMLQNGASRELLERWAPDPRNGVIMTGYSVEGTMGKLILREPDQIQAVMTRQGGGWGGGWNAPRGKIAGQQGEIMVPRRCSVEEYSFAAHVDGQENREFIEEVGAPVVVLVHGERNNMTRLKSKLMSLNADKPVPVKIFSPANCEELRIPFRTDKIAKVVGKLAEIPPPTLSSLAIRPASSHTDEANTSQQNGNTEVSPQLVTGVLVQSDFKMSLMAPEDLREYAGLTTTTITCRQQLTLNAAGVALIRWALEGTFGHVDERTEVDEALAGKSDGVVNGSGKVKKEDNQSDECGMEVEKNGEREEEAADEEIKRTVTCFRIMDCVEVRCGKGGREGAVEVEWEGNMVNDGIADAVLAVLFGVESSPAAVKQSSAKHSHPQSPPSTPLALRSPNPHANLTPSVRFDRLCMFLEAQFGPNITPLHKPRMKAPALSSTTAPPSPGNIEVETAGGTTENAKEDDLTAEERAEIGRLHALGIPVPGVEIQFDKHTARVWLEDLAVECANGVLRDRVRAVVERAAETVAPLWK
ncbi:metallo-beta-lactamase superfamily protein [Lineolata rhizophorae]|uniref:Metallo-beta-lactamase superfamily protein n=1 Tax=Lineolata rhizophorae TaxID=578093 RepID=A0A6A6PD79_9PEZI|nr:metallo-beta-lactamase superfamily protein [Lineolata rhizophorae]